MKDGGDLADFGREFGELAREDGLDAVGEGFVGLVVDFDEEAIAADGYGGAGERENFVAFAGAVAGIDHDGEMAAFFDGGYDGEVEGVAGKIGKGAHAALAEDDVVIAFAHHVFGGHQEFIERGGHATLQKHGKFGAAGAFEEREILHVARADLDDVGVFLDEVERFVVDCFGDDAEAVVFANFFEDFQAGKAESLEAVWRGARFVCAAAEEAHAGGLEEFGGAQALVLGFDGAGTGDHGDVAGRRRGRLRKA